MKLNCDLGESFGSWKMGVDSAVMPHIHMANIACGFHASDPLVMQKTLGLAAENRVEVGAHPGYPDLVGFGRRSMKCSEPELRALLHYQIAALSGMARVHGLQVTYVKPHGAMYNDMMRDMEMMHCVMRSVVEYSPQLNLVIQATAENDKYREMANVYGINLLFEAFADRAYEDSGLLVPRSTSGAVLVDPQQIIDRVVELSEQGTVDTLTGNKICLQPDTLCVHGDNAESVAQIQQIRKVLDAVSG